MSLLESVETAEVGDAWVGGLDLVGDTEDGRDLEEGGRDDLAVEDGLPHVADRLRARQPPAARRPRGRRRWRGEVRPPPGRRHPAAGSLQPTSPSGVAHGGEGKP